SSGSRRDGGTSSCAGRAQGSLWLFSESSSPARQGGLIRAHAQDSARFVVGLGEDLRAGANLGSQRGLAEGDQKLGFSEATLEEIHDALTHTGDVVLRARGDVQGIREGGLER